MAARTFRTALLALAVAMPALSCAVDQADEPADTAPVVDDATSAARSVGSA